jgi:hypothetical protein
MGSAPQPKTENNVKNLLLLLVVLVVCLAGVEAGLRILGISYPVLHQRDDQTGVAGIPGAEGWWTIEGRGHVRMNSDGFHDRAHEVSKPAGVRRVIVLGDSFTEAKEVMRADRYTDQLEGALTGCAADGSAKAEIFNFGNGGTGNVQALMALRSRGWKYGPDDVVLAFYTGNDVQDNFQALSADSIGRPFGVMRDGRLVIDTAFKSNPAFRSQADSRTRKWLRHIINMSAILQALNHLRGSGLATGGHAAGGSSRRMEPQAPYVAPDSETWREAWQVTESVIVRIRNEVRAQGARFWLMVISDPLLVHPDAVRGRISGAASDNPLDYGPEARIDALARREGIPTLFLLRPFREEVARTGEALHGFANALPGGGHWNEGGHRVAAKALAAMLCDRAALTRAR